MAISLSATQEGTPVNKKRWWRSLTVQILIGLAVGIIVGWLVPEWGNKLYFLRDIFLNLIKSIIAPLIFSTIVVGVAGGGDMKRIGRIGLKSIIYFEIVTILALAVGLLVVNLVQPGAGVVIHGNGDAAVVGKIGENHPKTLIETLVHVFPASVVQAAANGDVLQIVAFSLLFALAVAHIGDKARPVLEFCDSLSQVMFKFTGYVMRFAPYGVGAAMAHTVANQGLEVLKNLGLLIGSLYLALVIFVLVVLFPVALLVKVPLKQFLKAVWEPFTIAFVTTSSESALPKAMEVMERLGVPKHIVGFVMPTGYSFNLDGTTLYLAMASVFVAQAAEATTGQHFGLEQQITMMLALMVTSKGVAAVPRASLVVLLATLNSFMPNGIGPLAVAMIFGVDELMDMARTSVNVLGNCLATVVVARWEGVFDDDQARIFGTPDEPVIERVIGEPALADAAEDEAGGC